MPAKIGVRKFQKKATNEDDSHNAVNSMDEDDDGSMHRSKRRSHGDCEYEVTPLCFCHEFSKVFTSKQENTNGREFYSCPTRACKYFRWKDYQIVNMTPAFQPSSKRLHQQQANPQIINRHYKTNWDEDAVSGHLDVPIPGINLLSDDEDEGGQEKGVSQSSKISNQPAMSQQSSLDRHVSIEKIESKSTNRHAGGGATYVPINPLFGAVADPSSDELLQKQLSLSSKQLDVLKAILEKKNVFFSGAAGTGKSHVINVIKDIIKVLGLESKFAFTATTGVAACNIGGVTIHSWSGIGTVRFEDKGEPDLTIGRASAKKEVKRRWRTTDFLFIDEISMFSAELFDVLDRVGRRCREVEEPFGGIQIIVSGDFHQLPPIGLGSKVHHCFKSRVWEAIFTSANTFILDQIFRQKDPLFTSILNDLRRGTVSAECDSVMKRKAEEFRMGKINTSGGMKPTKLYPVNAKCDGVNTEELGKLTSVIFEFESIDESLPGPYLQNLEASCKAPKNLVLKVGTEVMLLKNLSVVDGFVNGARGVITKFVNRPHNCEQSVHFVKKNGINLPIVRFRVGDADVEQVIKEEEFTMKSNNIDVASRTQLPLMLAWAISIHKSQGMTIQNVQVSIDGVFADGQGYVALSRCTSLEGLVLENWPRGKIKADAAVTEFYKSFGYSNEGLTRELVHVTLGEICVYYAEKAAEITKRVKAAAAVKAADDESGWLDPKKKKLSNYKAPKKHETTAKEDAATFFGDTSKPSAPPNKTKIDIDFNKFAYSSTEQEKEKFVYVVDDSDHNTEEEVQNSASKPAAIPSQSSFFTNQNDSDQGFVYYVDEDSNMTTDESVVISATGKSMDRSAALNAIPDPRTMSVKELKATINSKGLAAKAVGFIEKHEFVALLLEEYSKSTTNGRSPLPLTPEQKALIAAKRQAALDRKARHEKNNF